tara:strand:- start:195 stop:2399 length:2205 start_codon:yes stop_codon:yes gene_type:complete
VKKSISLFLLTIFFSLNLLSDDAASEDVEIEVVEIIGSQEQAKEIAGAATVINSKDLEVYEYTDIHKILSNVPGVNFRPEEGYGLRPNLSIRGTYADRSGKITLMEDGILIAPAPYAASAAYYFPTAGRLAGVEVLKGPSSITQGPYTIGGAINLLSTPIPDETGGLFNQEFGEDQMRRTHFHYGVVRDNAAFLIESHVWETDGFDAIKNSQESTGFDKDDLVVKVRLNSNPDNEGIYHELNMKYQDADESSNQSYVGLTDVDFRKDPYLRYGLTAYDNMKNAHDTFTINYIADLGDLEFSITSYKNDFARNWFKVDKIDNKKVYGIDNGINNIIDAANSGEANALAILHGINSQEIEIKLKNNNRSYVSKGIDVKVQYHTDKQTLILGYRATEDKEDRFQIYEYANWLNGYFSSLKKGSPPGYSSNNRITSAEAAAFYINEEIYLGALSLSFGYRAEKWEVSQVRFVDAARTAVKTNSGYPKKLADSDNSLIGLGATYDIKDTTSLFFGFHQGFTPTSGGADPEQANNIEVGVRHVKDSTFVEFLYFKTDYQNMFGSCTTSGGAVEDCEIGDSFNAGGASINGIEFTLQSKVNSESGIDYPMSITYTSTKATFDNTFSSTFWGEVTSGMDIPDLPDTQIAVRGGFLSNHGWLGDVTLYSYGSTCSVASCNLGTEIDAYTVVDLSLSKLLKKNVDLYMKVENITDKKNIVSRAPKNGARAQKPRTVILGFRLKI